MRIYTLKQRSLETIITIIMKILAPFLSSDKSKHPLKQQRSILMCSSFTYKHFYTTKAGGGRRSLRFSNNGVLLLLSVPPSEEYQGCVSEDVKHYLSLYTGKKVH